MPQLFYTIHQLHNIVRLDIISDVYMHDSLQTNGHNRGERGIRRRVEPSSVNPCIWPDFLCIGDKNQISFILAVSTAANVKTSKQFLITHHSDVFCLCFNCQYVVGRAPYTYRMLTTKYQFAQLMPILLFQLSQQHSTLTSLNCSFPLVLVKTFAALLFIDTKGQRQEDCTLLTNASTSSGTLLWRQKQQHEGCMGHLKSLQGCFPSIFVAQLHIQVQKSQIRMVGPT